MPGPGTWVPIGAVARELGVSVSQVRLLSADGTLPPAARTPGGHRRYDLDDVRAAWARRQAPDRQSRPAQDVFSGWHTPTDSGDDGFIVKRTDALADLDEADVWRDIADTLDLPKPALRIARYAYTEMLNNAIDHSGGTEVHTRARIVGDHLTLEIADDGIGIFRHLRDHKDLPDLYAAIAELTKGKQTTAPEAHSGEGIFFTSKAVDTFTLLANGIGWVVDNTREDHAVGLSTTTQGTVVRMLIDRATTLDLGELFGQFTKDHRFARTRPVIKLFSIGVDFVSRSEAKRLAHGMEDFAEIELDFTGVDSVGQGFVDELFRVWANAHPETAVVPTNMNSAVEFMVTRGLPHT